MDTETTRLEGTHAASREEILEGLNDLLQLDHDAIGAYQAAIEKLEDRDHASQISGFLRDHERHVRELNAMITSMGGTPANEPHATGTLKKALQNLGGMAGDKGVLMAFRTNELQVRTKYDSYASKANHWGADAKRLVDRNALDEERHYRWVADTLAGMGIGSGEDPETHALNRAREAGGQVGSKVDQAKEKAGELASTARDKVTAARDAVANRISGMVDTENGPVGQARHRVEDARDQAAEQVHRFEDRVREKPLQTLLIAGVAGFVIGRLLR